MSDELMRVCGHGRARRPWGVYAYLRGVLGMRMRVVGLWRRAVRGKNRHSAIGTG